MRALFLRSRSQLVDSALEHLSTNYYANLAYEGKIRRGKYIVTRAGTVVDGMVVVSQESRRVLVSVTACDVAYFDERMRFLHTEIETPEPNRSIVLIEAAIIFLSVFFVFHTMKNNFSAIFVAGLLASIYFIWRMIEADDLKAQMQKMPSRLLYSYLPNFQYPANEHWLVVGEEIFEKHPHIQPTALNTLCAKQGLGLLVVGQDDVAHVFVHPEHQTLFVEAKYDYDFSQLPQVSI